MKRRKTTFLFSTDHFYKILIGLIVLSITAILGFYYFLFQGDRSFEIESKIDEEASQISEHIERKIILMHRNMLNNYIEKHRNGYSTPDKNMDIWLAQHSNTLSISYFPPNSREPYQILRSNLAEVIPTFDNPILQQEVYTYLYLHPVLYQTATSYLDIKTISLNESIYILMTCFHRDSISHEMFEAKYFLTGKLLEQVSTNLSLKQIAIFSNGGYLIWANTDKEWPHVKEINNRFILEDETLFYQYPFKELPFSLTIASQEPLSSNFSSLTTQFHILFPLVILLISALIGMLVTYWIDRPLKPFLDTVFELSKGNYNLRLPEQKNKSTSRLARLVNYIIEEMAYMQRINVGKIINEKNKTETILRNIADGVIVTDTDDRIMVMNKVAEKWFHLSEKDVIEQSITKNIHNTEFQKMLRQLKNGSDQASVEFKHRLYETGEMKILQAHAANIHNQDNHAVGVVTVLRDVTQSKEADRVKTELVSMVAHELKSPLTSIYGYSEMLLKSHIESIKALEYARIIMSESSRLTDFVNKFLDLSRIESGKTQLQFVPIDIVQIIQKIVKNYYQFAEKKKIEVLLELPDNLSLAQGDQEMIEQVVLNLFSNAVKYSPPRAKIGIEAHDEKGMIHVDITDSGYGISQSMLPKIFDKFYRIKDEEGHDVEGSGLGLALVKEIIERHHGTVSVKSTVGVGSVFTFTLIKY